MGLLTSITSSSLARSRDFFRINCGGVTGLDEGDKTDGESGEGGGGKDGGKDGGDVGGAGCVKDGGYKG